MEARRLEEQRAQQAEAEALALALAQQPRAKRAIQQASSVAAKVLSAVFRRAIHPSYGSCQPPQLPAAAPQQPVSSLAALLAGDRQHEPLPKVEQDLHTFPRQDASKLAQKMAQEQQQEAAQVAADVGVHDGEEAVQQAWAHLTNDGARQEVVADMRALMAQLKVRGRRQRRGLPASITVAPALVQPERLLGPLLRSAAVMTPGPPAPAPCRTRRWRWRL